MFPEAIEVLRGFLQTASCAADQIGARTSYQPLGDTQASCRSMESSSTTTALLIFRTVVTGPKEIARATTAARCGSLCGTTRFEASGIPGISRHHAHDDAPTDLSILAAGHPLIALYAARGRTHSHSRQAPWPSPVAFPASWLVPCRKGKASEPMAGASARRFAYQAGKVNMRAGRGVYDAFS
jgi:hypothetical protein